MSFQFNISPQIHFSHMYYFLQKFAQWRKIKEKEKYKILGGEIHRIEQNRQLHVYLTNPWVKYINCAKISKYPATCPVYVAGVKISIY